MNLRFERLASVNDKRTDIPARCSAAERGRFFRRMRDRLFERLSPGKDKHEEEAIAPANRL